MLDFVVPDGVRDLLGLAEGREACGTGGAGRAARDKSAPSPSFDLPSLASVLKDTCSEESM